MSQALKKQKVDASGVEKFDADAVNSKESRSLYVAREKIHPKRVNGTFRHLKWWIMGITLGIYYITPWLRWDRGAQAPDQAVLVDVANRRFYFFFIEIWPHEFFYVAGMLVMAGIGLFLVTSTLGRAWCGYTCPQTVWVDLYLVVERFFEGDRNARIKLDSAPWTLSKVIKRSQKHVVWLLIGGATGGAWIFYFADAPSLFVQLFTGQAPTIAYITVAILTATTYVFGGFMREQVCTYMCPWPRIQAAMLDQSSLTVTYNAWRGEKRSRHAKRLRKQGQSVGDCVDCNACVAVCPMGIDIRDGQQLECITCALCIDACDTVMTKLGLEKGLIGYSTLDDYTVNMQLAGATGTVGEMTSYRLYEQVRPEQIRKSDGKLIDALRHTSWRSVMTVRTYLYTAIYVGIGLALLAVLATRDRLDLNVIPDRNPIFVQLSDGSIRNGYQIKILNMRGEEREFLVESQGLSGALMRLAGSSSEPSKTVRVTAAADKLKAVRIFVTLPEDKILSQHSDFTFSITASQGDETAKAGARFEAPERFER